MREAEVRLAQGQAVGLVLPKPRDQRPLTYSPLAAGSTVWLGARSSQTLAKEELAQASDPACKRAVPRAHTRQAVSSRTPSRTATTPFPEAGVRRARHGTTHLDVTRSDARALSVGLAALRRRGAMLKDTWPTDVRAGAADIVRLANQYGRYGYRRIREMLVAEGWRVNVKRVYRIWRREGLKVPRKQPKRAPLRLNHGSCIQLLGSTSSVPRMSAALPIVL